MTAALVSTDLPFPLVRRGKVRDVYDLGDAYLFVATDRISAFDVVLSPGIPGKGIVLTQISNFWFDYFEDSPESHLLAEDFDRFPDEIRRFEELRDRSVVVKKCEVIPVECVARGYLAGSGLKEYEASRTVCGIPLEEGLVAGSRLPKPIFTPATKAEAGHDENISFERMCEITGVETALELRRLTMGLYLAAAEYALTRGIIIADTKFEFGLFEDRIIWIDEALTPDSSRFWPKALYEPGRSQPSYDKQFVRDYLEEIKWNKQPPVPTLPDEVVAKTREKYLEAYRVLTGRDLDLS